MQKPVACTLTIGGMRKRRRRWHDLATRGFVRRVETDRGLRLLFRADPGVEQELRELAALERECCGFADWNVSSDGKYVMLDVAGTGDQGVAAVREMFRSPAS